MIDKINKIIEQGIKFLAKEQQEDGSFLSLSFTNERDLQGAKIYKTTFTASLIFSCLNNLEETPQIKTIKQKIVDFLLSQKSKHWSFNYWARNSEGSKEFPYPDDLDDTCCALSALFQYNPGLIDGNVLAKVVTVLTALEKEEGGPYRTWLVPPDAKPVWKDIDLAVNSNIAYFLSLHDVCLPKVNGFIEETINNQDYSSPYYPSSYPITYFISRFYKGNKTNLIKDFLISQCDASGKWDNPLNTALAVLSLFNLNVSPDRFEKTMSYLIQHNRNGGIKAYPFVRELITKDKTYYAGSAALTTAFCLEAINKFKVRSSKIKVVIQNSKINNQEIKSEESEIIYKAVVERAKQRFSLLGDDLRKQALGMLDKTLKSDKDKQIVLMPYFFKMSLGKQGRGLSDNLIIQLGLANLYGWMAYTIYDDFLDDEGRTELLSVANLALRELTEIFNNVLSKKTGFPGFFKKILDIIDSANTWEQSNCRFKGRLVKDIPLPDYKDFSKLAERSLGHSLGPATILFSLGYNENSQEVQSLMEFFKDYIIARQLNDEAHDWEQDLNKGHINAVGSLILREVKKKEDLLRLQEIFWYDVSVGVCNSMLNNVQKARQALMALPIVADTSLFEKLLAPIESSARQTIEKQKETIKFLKSYEQKE